MPHFFIDRPVFAWVVALFILLAGALAIPQLPVAQYPNVAPPQVEIYAVYPGASAATMDESVVSLIEQELNGADNLLYFESQSSLGSATITATFEPGTHPDLAQVDVQNRLKVVESRLPRPVTQQGLQVEKVSTGFLLLATLTSEDGKLDETALSDILARNVMNEIRRLKGVGKAQLYGSERAMRIWIDPSKLIGFNLTPNDVADAIAAQNAQVAPGSIGDLPARGTQEITANVLVKGQLSTPEEFAAIVLRANADGSTVTVGDVARVEIGAQEYQYGTRLNGKPATAFSVQLAPGANAMETADLVRAKMQELSRYFPEGVKYDIPYDTSPFVKVSIQQVINTLFEAMLLVFAVMFLFLQNLRYTLIPTLVVPVALMGTFAVMLAMGFSVNVLTLFGMVLAIGILVDDAIVVVENVERIMREEGLNPRRATVKAMGQITSAIIGITLVLIAVFIPMAFFPGSTGGIYRQFSVTLAISIFFSALLALTLTPALCATLLKATHDHDNHERPAPKPGIAGWPQRFFAWFNDRFGRVTEGYATRVGTMVRAPGRWLAVFAVMCVVTVVAFTRLPGGFLPTEDQGYFFASYTAPPGATMQRTQASVDQAEAFLRQQPQVRNIVSIVGFSFFGQGQSAALSFVDLKPWDERGGASNSASALVQRANAAFSNISGAMVFALDPPPIQALGNATGFTMKLEDRSGEGGVALQQAAQQIMAQAGKSKTFAAVRQEGLPPAPQLHVDIDRIKARSLGLRISDVNQTLAVAFGSAYANDFVHDGNVLRVYLQADAAQRMSADDVASLRVRNDQGLMVPFSAFTQVKWTAGPQQLERYNGYPSITLSGQAAPGQSSGAALVEMERIASKVLTGDMSYEWTGTAFEEKQAGGQIGLLLGLSVVVVFLLLAALYESWPIPLAVLLVVPFGVLGAVVFTMLRGLAADVYFNVGLITIIGLAAKNAILIVEFAVEQEAEGVAPLEATINAARLRLRPILMTSLAFILGMVPLVIASGAGAASRHAVGTGVAGGMITATIFGVFFTPVFYTAMRLWLVRKRDHESADAHEEAKEQGHSNGETSHA